MISTECVAKNNLALMPPPVSAFGHSPRTDALRLHETTSTLADRRVAKTPVAAGGRKLHADLSSVFRAAGHLRSAVAARVLRQEVPEPPHG